jgi:hypothetical protein
MRFCVDVRAGTGRADRAGGKKIERAGPGGENVWRDQDRENIWTQCIQIGDPIGRGRVALLLSQWWAIVYPFRAIQCPFVFAWIAQAFPPVSLLSILDLVLSFADLTTRLEYA